MIDELHIEDELKIRTMQYFAKNYIESSMIFSSNARTIEDKESINEFDSSNYKANVIGSILFTVLYLETSINEFYILVTGNNNFINETQTRNKKIINEFWNSDKFANYSILDKYQYALILMDCDKFNDTINPFQNIKTLISLRNYLVHYKPEWIEMQTYKKNNNTQFVSLEKKIKGTFNTTKIGNDFFPAKYLSYGCAIWGIDNSIQFVNEFYDKIGKEYIYKEIINELRKNYGA